MSDTRAVYFLLQPSDFVPCGTVSTIGVLLRSALHAQRCCGIISLIIIALVLFSILLYIPVKFGVVLAVFIIVRNIIHSELALDAVFDHRSVSVESIILALYVKRKGFLKDRIKESGCSLESLFVDVYFRSGHVNVIMEGPFQSSFPENYTQL